MDVHCVKIFSGSNSYTKVICQIYKIKSDTCHRKSHISSFPLFSDWPASVCNTRPPPLEIFDVVESDNHLLVSVDGITDLLGRDARDDAVTYDRLTVVDADVCCRMIGTCGGPGISLLPNRRHLIPISIAMLA